MFDIQLHIIKHAKKSEKYDLQKMEKWINWEAHIPLL